MHADYWTCRDKYPYSASAAIGRLTEGALEPNLFRFIWRNSRTQQLVVLGIIVLSLPFYFASFDVPKQIINDALQGKAFSSPNATVRFLALSLPLPEALGGTLKLTNGFEVSQLGLLWGLSTVFLVLVIINGAFKYYINVMKGILGERLLRRLRFVLLDQYLRFRPEDIRGVKPSEAASIIKDEVDPIGTFAGDAFILPAFLSMQALTAIVFILAQSVWLGLVALIVVLIQAVVIPILRREQLRLTQLRQIESRKLAGQVGEIVETAPAIQVIGAGDYTRGGVAHRLEVLFDIRVKLFKRKFSVKYLNNLLAQVTPFFFYAIGGYLALTGDLNIGQLVAAIAAYKDLPPPIKDLIDWDQSRADVLVKYQQIVSQFPAELLPADDPAATLPQPASDAPLSVSSLKFVDSRGTTLLDALTISLPRPGHIALVGVAGSGRDALARILGRQISGYRGRIAIGGATWSGPNHAPGCLLMTYAGQDAHLFSGSIRDNLLAGLQRRPELPAPDDSPAGRRLRREAELSGTPVQLPDSSWLDLRGAGVSSEDELTHRMLRILARTGLADDVYRLGVLSKIDPAAEQNLVAKVPAARELILRKLKERDLLHLVEPLDPKMFNRNATLAENMLFGQTIGPRFADGSFASDPYMRSILEAESLLFPLSEIGLAMAETAIEVFADLSPGDPLFARFSYIDADDMPEYQKLVDQVRSRGGVTKLAMDGQARLVELALSYMEPRHRLQLVPPELQQRILRARQSFRRHLPQSYADHIEFYQPDRFMVSGTLRDNLLFGRIAFDEPDAINRVRDIAMEALQELSLDLDVYRIGLAFEVGPSGRLLQQEQRASLALARALMPLAAVVVLDGAFSPFGPSEAGRILADIRAEMAGRTLIVSLQDQQQAAGFDSILLFDGPRLAEARVASGSPLGPTALDAPEEVMETTVSGRSATLAKEDRHAVE
jgi:putative ABC transport system ATP-binding protein